MNVEEIEKIYEQYRILDHTEIKFLFSECKRLAELAAIHLADQELLVCLERKRVARECADYINNKYGLV